MTENHDDLSHRDLETSDQPLDAANQSLSDALRASFSVLKGIMGVLVVLFLFSNVKGIESHEEAIVLRMGKLHQVVDHAGLVWALPFPIDEIIPFPTRKSNELLVRSHTFHRKKNEIGKPLSFISRGHQSGLHPTLDGALFTADAGLVHVQWKVTYKINDLESYITGIQGDGVDAAQNLLRVLVETTGVELATEFTADELIRTRFDEVQSEMRRRINLRLASLGSGMSVTMVEMFEPTPPIQVRDAFDQTQRAENTKEQLIQRAEKTRNQILNGVAGAAYQRILAVLDQLDVEGQDDATRDRLSDQIDAFLVDEVEGRAGKRIKDAGAYRAVVVTEMESDIARYRTLVPEYRRNPLVLINRLWEETRERIFAGSGVRKIYRPSGIREFRLKIPLDPDAERLAKERALREKEFDVKSLRKEHLRPIGPGQE